MTVVVDTTVWSVVLRRRPGARSPEQCWLRLELSDLIRDGRVLLLGAVRQVVLSGLADAERFARLREYLRAFEDEPTITWDYERAAENFNICRAHGIQGSPVDFLICAVAERVGAPIFTADPDFDHYAQHLPIRLHCPPAR